MRREFDEDVLWQALGRLKSHLRLTSCDLDDELRQKLRAAVCSAEHQIGRVIFPSRFTDIFDFAQTVRLAAPLLSVDTVRLDGVELNKDWSWTANRRLSCISIADEIIGKELEVSWTSGMEDIPDDLMNAILLIASSLFSNPLDSVETLPKASAALLRPYRNYEL